MLRPDFRYIKHSAKGSVWKEHKYIRKENGRYIYPENDGGSSKEKIIENVLKRMLEEGWDPGAIEQLRNGDITTKEELEELWSFINATELDRDESWLETLKEIANGNKGTDEEKKVDDEIAITKEKIEKRKEKLTEGLKKEELDEMWDFANTIKEKDDEDWLKTLVDFGNEVTLTKSEKSRLNKEIAKVREEVKDLYHYGMNTFYYLSHGGPGSGRYPLGSGERPYQKFEGSGRRRSGISGYIRSVKSKKAEEKQQKQRNEELRKRMEEEKKKRQHDSDKERVLREGTATEVLKYQGELTNQELQNAFTRLNLESQLRNLSQREMKTAMDKVDNLMKTVKTGTEWAKIGTDTYNTFAAIYNATPEGQKKPLTLVGKGGKDKSKKND